MLIRGNIPLKMPVM